VSLFHIGEEGRFMFSTLHRGWQNLLIWLARNERLKAVSESSVTTARLVERYIGGPTTKAGVSRATGLQRVRLSSSMFFLGEYVRDEATVSETVESILDLVRLTVSASLDTHISVDPTAIGYSLSPVLCERNALLIAQAIQSQNKTRPGRHCLMLDMEDLSLVDYTIDLHNKFLESGLPVALTLQAYLFRSEEDVKKEILKGSAVRLVRGAFAEGRRVAYQSQREIGRQYLQLARLMLTGATSSPHFYPIFGTHNEELQEKIILMAEELGLSADRFEFEMLLGVRPELASRLSERRLQVRIYVPCGRDWWGYVNRRIGESPRNALLVLRAICS